MRHFYFPMELSKCLEWSNRLVQIKVLLGTVLLNSRTASPSQSNCNDTVNAMRVRLFQHGKDRFAFSLRQETLNKSHLISSTALVNSFIVVDKKVLFLNPVCYTFSSQRYFAQTYFALIAQLSKLRTVTGSDVGMIRTRT